MMAFILLTIVVALYAIFILWCLIGWSRLPARLYSDFHKESTVDVIIPMRNESASIAMLVASLSKQTYSHARFLFVDDHSTDQTISILQSEIEKYGLKNTTILDSPSEGKKGAIDFAVRKSTAELILTTDADCSVSPGWIRAMLLAADSTGADFIAGPVMLNKGSSLLEKMQSLEMIGLAGIAGASFAHAKPILCNGANLLYRKDAYLSVNGFTGSQTATGDDTQLMRKLSETKGKKLFYLNDSNAVVSSNGLSKPSDFFRQRRRWASKIPYTLSPFTVVVSFIAFLTHFGLLLALPLVFIFPDFIEWYLTAFLLKIIPEFLFLKEVARLFNRKTNLLFFIFIQPVYWLYITLVGLLVPAGAGKWKGRSLSIG